MQETFGAVSVFESVCPSQPGWHQELMEENKKRGTRKDGHV
jgi:hypothetical protein